MFFEFLFRAWMFLHLGKQHNMRFPRCKYRLAVPVCTVLTDVETVITGLIGY